MPLSPTWADIAVRLALTVLAGAIIGLNRGAHGHAAGLRTTILVCLAASVAMIQANILLPLSGKTSESFAVMDLMRLPLGILTGVGLVSLALSRDLWWVAIMFASGLGGIRLSQKPTRG